MVLSPRLPLFEDESTRSWLERLTAFHGPESVEELCRQLGINDAGLEYGVADDIYRLAEVTGEHPALIRRNLLSRTTSGSSRIGQHALADLLTPISARRVCLYCLREDAKSGPAAVHLRERWEWHLLTLDQCRQHRRRLVSLEGGDDWRSRALELASGLSERKGRKAPGGANRFHDWLIGELRQRSTEGWVCEMTLQTAVDAIGLLGACIGLQTGEDWQYLDADRKHEALNVGLDLLCFNRDVLRPAILEGFQGDGAKRSPWFRRIKAWASLRRQLSPGCALLAELNAALSIAVKDQKVGAVSADSALELDVQ